MIEIHDVGDRLIATARLTVDGSLQNTSSAVFRVKPPSGATIVPAVTNPEVGVYRCEVQAAMGGPYWIRFEAAGDVVAAEEVEVRVARSMVLP